MNIQQRILRFVTCSNWVLLLITSVTGGLIATFDFTLGIITGGLIVTINFHLIYRMLNKALISNHTCSTKSLIAKYYIRLVLSVVIIFILVSKNYVAPGGLLIGLSIVVASIMIAALCELKKVIIKEAA